MNIQLNQCIKQPHNIIKVSHVYVLFLTSIIPLSSVTVALEICSTVNGKTNAASSIPASKPNVEKKHY